MNTLLSILLIVAFICLAPALFLFSVNTLAELGGVAFYIDHGVYSYFISLLFVACVRGNS